MKYILNEDLLTEDSHYDKQAVKILTDSGMCTEEQGTAIIDSFQPNHHGVPRILHEIGSPSWTVKYLKGIARMIVEESHGNLKYAKQFIDDNAEIFDNYLRWLKDIGRVKADTKEKLAELENNFINNWSFDDFKNNFEPEKQELEKISTTKLQSFKPDPNKKYTITPIESYEQLHRLFGGKRTGDGTTSRGAGDGGNAWCHTNIEDTYDKWVREDAKFYVLEKEGWEDIPAEVGSGCPKDEYGLSLMAILVGYNGKLLACTLRWNHIHVPSGADHQFQQYYELSETVGLNVKEAVEQDLHDHGLFEIVDTQDINTQVANILKTTDTIEQDTISEHLKKYVTVVNIPEGVTSINDQAFYDCKNLTTLTLPNSLTNIGIEAFYGCKKLDNVIVPKSVLTIEDSAFEECRSLKSIIINNPDTIIGDYTFYNCVKLPAFKLPDNLLSIGHGTFGACENLLEISIPANMTLICDSAFTSCVGLTNVYMNTKLHKIGIDAFSNCTSLKDFIFPETLRIIEERAFSGCTSLDTLTIPRGVYSVGRNAFSKCTRLNTIICKSKAMYDTLRGDYDNVVQQESLLTSTGKYLLSESLFDDLSEESELSESTNLIEDLAYTRTQYPTLTDEEFETIIELDPTYQQGSNSIGKYGKWLLNIYKKNPQEIQDTPTDEVTELLSVFIKNNKALQNHDIGQFKTLDELRTALNNLPEVTLTHRQTVRQNQKARHAVSIEEDADLVYEDEDWSVYTPNTYAASCKLGLGTKWCTASTESRSYYDEYTESGKLYIIISNIDPTTKYQWHKETESFMDSQDKEADILKFLTNNIGLKQFFIRYDIVDDIDALSVEYETYTYTGEALSDSYRKYVKHIIIPDDVTLIGADTFMGCENAISLKIGNNVQVISYYAFADCKKIENIILPKSLTKILDGAFGSCISLKEINIPDSVEKIGNSCFARCTSLRKVHLPTQLTAITSSTFFGCSSLTDINLPDSLHYIEDEAFKNCAALPSVTVPYGLVGLGDMVFMGCTGLQSLRLPDFLSYLPIFTISDCKSLHTLVIPRRLLSEDVVMRLLRPGFCENLKVIKYTTTVHGDSVNELTPFGIKRLKAKYDIDIIKVNTMYD